MLFDILLTHHLIKKCTFFKGQLPYIIPRLKLHVDSCAPTSHIHAFTTLLLQTKGNSQE